MLRLSPSASKTRHLPFSPKAGAHAEEEEKNTLHSVIVDIGTGSGCIALTLAFELQKFFFKNSFHIFGIDISERALGIAKKNAKKFDAEETVTFIKSNLLDSFLSPASPFSFLSSPFSLVLVANLPYVPPAYLDTQKTNLTEGLSFEPRSALDGGQDGFDVYRKLLEQIQTLRKKMPNLSIDCFFEIGFDQATVATHEIRTRFPDSPIRIVPDLAGQPRVVCFSLGADTFSQTSLRVKPCSFGCKSMKISSCYLG